MTSVLPILRNLDPTDNLENFNYIFNDILKNPEGNILKNSKLYTMGMKLLVQDLNVELKEDILKKLIFLFPDNDEFYYYMGYIFKDTDIYKALMWFKICFNINKNNIDNLLDMFKILFDNEYKNFIKFMDKTHDVFNKKNLNDERILLLLSTIHLKEHKIKEVEVIYEKLLEKITNKEITDESFICALYNNIGQLYGNLLKPNIINNLYKEIIYICKTSKTVSPILKRKMFENIMMLMFDYKYYDTNERFQLCKEMTTEIYKIENLYDFSQRNKKPNKIKLGYVSSDFVYHAVSNFILPIIENHNTDNFEIYLFIENNYEDVKIVIDKINKNIHVININNVSTLVCSNLINNLEIDILIDLNGYTDKNRLDVFSKNPAPVQINYLGYPNTLGLSCIQYRITDNICDHINSIQCFSEKLIRMPESFLLFKSVLQKEKFEPKIKNEHDEIILGSLNKEFKISENTLNCWKTILEKSKNTKILIKLNNIDNIEYGRDFFMNKLNISTDRLIIYGYCTNTEYIGLLQKIDILLDTFPYSGTTTTCNALYNSIPVITLFHKDYHVHNVTSSLLINCNFPELVTYTEEEYINKTIELCNNMDLINNYKINISNNFNKLMNPTKFITNYENLLRDTFYQHFNNIDYNYLTTKDAFDNSNYPVIVSFSNFGYIKFAENCILSLKKMKNHSVVFYCLDIDTYNYLSNIDTGNLDIKYILFDKFDIPKEFSNFYTKDFIKIVTKKLNVIFDALEKYKYIHYIDSDVVCINEPTITFYSDYTDYDIVFQYDGTDFLYGINQCTGNMTLKYNYRTICLLKDMEEKLTNNTNLADQDALVDILSKLCKGDIRTIQYCKLSSYPIERYTSGYMFLNKIIQKENIIKDCYFFHANWCIGSDNKQNLLKNVDFWLIEEEKQ